MSQGHDHGHEHGHGAPVPHGLATQADHGHGGHHGDVRNPDYDGPSEHCLPPDVKPSLFSGIGFALILAAIAAGAAWLGTRLL